MKVISIWQPYATMTVRGFKFFETRTWAPPASVIGQRVGIASTKNVTAAQKAAFNDENFQFFYSDLDMPAFDDLPRGYLLGSAILDSYEEINEEFLDEITKEEQAYGWYHLGGYAWRWIKPEVLEHPIPIRGAQGLYDYRGFDAPQTQVAQGKDQGSAPALRLHLHVS